MRDLDMSFYTIHLVNLQCVRPSGITRQVIEGALGPLIQQAGMTLNLVSVSVAGDCDISLSFNMDRRRFGAQFTGGVVLAEQSGAVLVGSILDLRVGGTRTSRDSFFEPVRSIFQNGEEAFARTVGNIAVHELGHAIGGLTHLREERNYMYTGAFLRERASSWFTYDNLRQHWSASRSFNSTQRQALISAIRSREIRGLDVTPL